MGQLLHFITVWSGHQTGLLNRGLYLFAFNSCFTVFTSELWVEETRLGAGFRASFLCFSTNKRIWEIRLSIDWFWTLSPTPKICSIRSISCRSFFFPISSRYNFVQMSVSALKLFWTDWACLNSLSGTRWMGAIGLSPLSVTDGKDMCNLLSRASSVVAFLSRNYVSFGARSKVNKGQTR